MEAADEVQSRQSILNPESQTLSKLPAKKSWYLKPYFTLNLPLYKKMFVSSWFSKAMQSGSMKYDIAMVAEGRQT